MFVVNKDYHIVENCLQRYTLTLILHVK